MKKLAASLALWAVALVMPAMAQDNNGLDRTTVVNAVYIEQAPGLLVDARIARGVAGPYIAEVRRQTPEGKVETRLIRLPAGVRVQVGDSLSAPLPANPGPRQAGTSAKAQVLTPGLSSSDADCVPLVAGR
jgi:hypothetical protein